jgi:hypothetical protein
LRRHSEHGDGYNLPAMSPTAQAQNLFKIRIASGEHQGFYVGPRVAVLLVQPMPQAERPLPLKGMNYMLYTLESSAICFGSSVALEVQADLRSVGVDSELI